LRAEIAESFARSFTGEELAFSLHNVDAKVIPVGPLRVPAPKAG
jgi:hypothetical protein